MQIDVIDPRKTAMIVVDMQNDFVAPGAAMETPAARQIVPKLAEALRICREAGKVVYTAHVHRRDGCDMGLFDDLHPPIANRNALVDGTPGVEIYAELAPRADEHVIKKHRYSGRQEKKIPNTTTSRDSRMYSLHSIRRLMPTPFDRCRACGRY